MDHPGRPLYDNLETQFSPAILAGRLLLGFAALAVLSSLWTSAAAVTELRVGFSDSVATLDPGNHRSRSTETVLRNLYDGLVTRDSDMQVVPELATSWHQLDPLRYEFELRRGVEFHDGTELTAEDVAFSIERIIRDGGIGGKTSPRRGLLGPVERIEVVGRYTFHVVLKQPWPILISMLPFHEVVSRSYVQDVGDATFASRANGTGPFRLVEWQPERRTVMERFPRYYGGAPDIPPVGVARVDRVVFEVLPDARQRIDALLSGRVDIIDQVPRSAVHRLVAHPETRIVAARGTRTFFVALNNRRPPFDDVRVRHALNHAIDKQAIIDGLLHGNAQAVNGVLSPQAFGFAADLEAYEFDPRVARRLLTEAGYPDGIDVAMDGDDAWWDLLDRLAAQLRAAGVRVRIGTSASSVALYRRWLEGDPADLVLLSWGNASLDPVGILPATLRTGGRGNVAGYSNPEVDGLLDEAELEIDPRQRARLYRNAQYIINRDAPWIFLWVPADLYGINRRVQGWRPGGDGRINLHDTYVK